MQTPKTRQITKKKKIVHKQTSLSAPVLTFHAQATLVSSFRLSVVALISIVGPSHAKFPCSEVTTSGGAMSPPSTKKKKRLWERKQHGSRAYGIFTWAFIFEDCHNKLQMFEFGAIKGQFENKWK